jgi:hypothetical protein
VPPSFYSFHWSPFRVRPPSPFLAYVVLVLVGTGTVYLCARSACEIAVAAFAQSASSAVSSARP